MTSVYGVFIYFYMYVKDIKPWCTYKTAGKQQMSALLVDAITTQKEHNLRQAKDIKYKYYLSCLLEMLAYWLGIEKCSLSGLDYGGKNSF